MTRFNQNFLWGSASAAYQIEGAVDTDGKGESVWDVWAHLEGKTHEGTNGDIATDHYNRYEEDVALMKKIGLKAYRFSISWTRILPNGTGKVNPEGIDFYNRLINLLIENDIEPLVTLYHWDLPQILQTKYLGWESEQIVHDFTAYARTCFKAFGDRVKYWIVMNEPNIFTQLGYIMAVHPPGKQDDELFLKTYHHTALAHAHTVLAYKEMGFEGQIGSSIAFTPAYAGTPCKEDQEALKSYYDIGPWWYLDSYYRGCYPEDAIAYYKSQKIELPFKKGDFKIMKAAAAVVDFIGVNYYQTAMIAYNPLDGVGVANFNTSGKKGTQKESGIPGLYKTIKNPNIEYTDWDWAIDPDGLRYGLVELNARYNLPILISENGLGAFDTINSNGEIVDDYRINFLKAHIEACKKAVDEDVDLLGYMTWSFTDLLSWLNGFKKRYGFVFVDFEDEALKRVPKKSFYWYKKVIESNGEVL